MGLHPAPHKLTKEAILVFGVQSAGKSLSWATVRYWNELTETPSHMYVIATEQEEALRTAEGYLDGSAGNNFFSNATIAGFDAESRSWSDDTPHDYDTLLAATAKIAADATENDWIVVDSIGLAQTWARDVWFTAEKGMTSRDFIAAGRPMKEVKPADWDTMDDLYQQWYQPYIRGFPGHRLACARMEAIRTEGEWAEKSHDVLRNYGPHGVKPVGHKNLYFNWHSVLLLNRGRSNWEITTIDDPKRTYLDHAPINDFVMDYLLPVAGWVMD